MPLHEDELHDSDYNEEYDGEELKAACDFYGFNKYTYTKNDVKREYHKLAKKYYPKDLKDPKLTEKFKKVSTFRTILDKYVDVRDARKEYATHDFSSFRRGSRPSSPLGKHRRYSDYDSDSDLESILRKRRDRDAYIKKLQEYYDALKSYCEAEEEKHRAQRKEEEQRYFRHIAEREQRRQEWLRKVYEEEDRRRAEEKEERQRIFEYEEACRKAKRERRRNEEWDHHGARHSRHHSSDRRPRSTHEQEIRFNHVRPRPRTVPSGRHIWERRHIDPYGHSSTTTRIVTDYGDDYSDGGYSPSLSGFDSLDSGSELSLGDNDSFIFDTHFDRHSHGGHGSSHYSSFHFTL